MVKTPDSSHRDIRGHVVCWLSLPVSVALHSLSMGYPSSFASKINTANRQRIPVPAVVEEYTAESYLCELRLCRLDFIINRCFIFWYKCRGYRQSLSRLFWPRWRSVRSILVSIVSWLRNEVRQNILHVMRPCC